MTPSAPLGILATAGYAMATVQWQQPASGGDSPITSYVATAQPGGQQVTVAIAAGAISPPRQAIFINLTNGQPLSFVVQAVNGSGPGPASLPSGTVACAALPPSNVPSSKITQYGVGIVAGSVFAPAAAPNWTADAFVGDLFWDDASNAWPIVSNTTTALTVTGTPLQGANAATAIAQPVLPQAMQGHLPNALTSLIAAIAYHYGVYYPTQQIPAMWIGRQHLKQHDDVPRIIFVIKGGKWTGSNKLGDGISAPEQIWDRWTIVQAHCWGGIQSPSGDPEQDWLQSIGACEFLVNNMAASLERIAPGTKVQADEQWNPKSDGDTARGAEMVLDIKFEIPVTDYQEQLVTVTALPQTMEVVDPT